MAAASSLGTLTLALLAETGGYVGPLEKAERLTLQAMRNMGAAVDEFGNYTDKSYKRIAQAADQLDASYGRMFEDMQRQIALYGEVSRASGLAYDLQKGHLRNLSEEQKSILLVEARRLDAMDDASAAFVKQAAEIQSLNSAHESLLAGLQKEVTLQGDASRAASIRYDLSLGKLKELDAAKKSEILTELAIVEARESETRASAAAAATAAQLNRTHDSLEDSMLQELSLYGEVSRAAHLRYRIEQGDLRELDSAQSQNLLTLAEQLDSLADSTDEAAGGFRGLRGVALSAGYQLQDVIVQYQAGTNAFIIFSQQGSQFASAFGPQGAIIGAVIAVAGVVGGVLFSSFMKAQEAVKDLETNVQDLIKDYADLTDAQREVADKGLAAVMDDRTKKYEEGTKAIEEQSKALQELKDSGGLDLTFKNAASAALLLSAQIAKITTYGVVDKTDEMWARFSPEQDVLDKTKELTSLRVSSVKALREMEELKDVTGGTKVVNSLREEVELLGLRGKVLYEAIATQKMYTGEVRQSFIALNLFKEAQKDSTEFKKRIKDLNDETLALQLKNAEIHKNVGLMDELAKKLADSKNTRPDGSKIGSPAEQEELAAAELRNTKLKEKNALDTDSVAVYKQQDKAAKDRILSLQREIDLFGISSKAQQLEYDIKSGLIKVNGGLESSQAKLMISLTQELAVKEKLATLAKSQAEVEFAGYDNRKGDIESTRMQYELDTGILQVNKDLTKEYYEQLILDKKRIEAKLNIRKADDYLTNLQHSIAEAKLITGEEKLRYKIMTDQLYVQGGINSAKAQELLATQRVFDAQARQLQMTDAIKEGLVDALMAGAAEGKDIFQNLADTIKGIFQTLVLKPVLDNFTDDLAKQLSGMLGSVGTKDSQGNTTGAVGVLGSLGPWGAVAAAVVAGVSMYNKEEEAKFAKMEAAYRQGTQSTGTILGEANKKSESISNVLADLESTASNTLGVNRSMYQALLDIRTGISGAAAGFARTGLGGAGAPDIQTGVTNMWSQNTGGGNASASLRMVRMMEKFDPLIGEVAGFFADIGGAMYEKISKAVLNKKTSIIDSGIKIVGTSLADILTSGTIEAFTYADVKTTKSLLGLKYSTKVNEKTEALDSMFESQFADIFANAGQALELASGVFQTQFDPTKLFVDPQKLSLKDLEGDALTKEIESFFSSTLDNWAATLVGGTTVLEKFQAVGEGAFETVMRLASQLSTFAEYTKLLDLNFKATGVSAIEASQAIIDAAGGFDKLTSGLGSYYNNFFTETERADKEMGALTEQFRKLGYDALPATREEFRALVEKLDLTKTADQELFASLIGLADSFAGLVDWTGKATEATRTLQSIAEERYALEIRQLEALGLTAEVVAMNRKKELESMDESNRQLLLDIYAIEDYNEALQAKIKAEEEAAQAMKELASSMFDALSASISAEKSRIEGIVANASSAKTALDDAIGREKDTRTKAHEDRLKQLEAQGQAEQQLAQQMANAQYESLRAIAKAQQEATKDQIKQFEKSISGLAKLFEDLNGAIFDIAIVTDEVTRSRRRAAEFEIENAITNARAGRGVPTDGSINEALSILRNNPTQLYASLEEMAYATAVTQNKLIDLAGLTQTQKTNEEQTLELLNAQLVAQEKAYNSIEKLTVTSSGAAQDLIASENARFEAEIANLDAIAEDARKQFDKLTGIDTTLLTLNEAQEAFSKAMLAADFENAKAQIEALEAIELNAKSQLNAMLGVQEGVVLVEDALRQFIDTVDLALKTQYENSADKATSELKETYNAMLEEAKANREESYNLLLAIRKSGQDTADTLMRMEEEAITV